MMKNFIEEQWRLRRLAFPGLRQAWQQKAAALCLVPCAFCLAAFEHPSASVEATASKRLYAELFLQIALISAFEPGTRAICWRVII
ncbi:hypothetical protein SAMN05216387_11432 [Nitrosovibrio tenuis]|uniref:Uncharacterized protein n=1 Tax=Nitrosovibrio tenuis TaxID=1233 RepID=A0A1H7R008_9PROT|nr:hypothetical protein SAMN05216387_11432 [Nitrosovibrio tenuis]